MEARKITVVSTKTQKKSVITSSAETLAQLKADLRAAGIDYEDMTFYEGTSKTELKSDDSVLPKDVPYTNRTTGETVITNNLVFMLTNPNKKINSGNFDRKELLNFVKEHNLNAECRDRYGKPYTCCSNKELSEFVVEAKNTACSCGHTTTSEDIVALLVEELINNNIKFSNEFLDKIGVKVTSPYSDEEIDDMLAECGL